MTSDPKRILAIDLGGTKILAALFVDGHLAGEERMPSLAGESVEATIGQMSLAIERVLQAERLALEQLDAISIAAAGPIDSTRGVITQSPNLPGWHNVPLASIIRERYKAGIFLINDAKAAALGEHRFGAGKGTRHMVMLTVGTGIGGGIIIDGKLYFGALGGAGEVGHMVIDVHGPRCRCGNKGCLEMLASGTAMARKARWYIDRHERTTLVEVAGGRTGSITAETIGAAARAGDKLAVRIIEEAAVYLGVGMANLANIFNPEMIVVGGGVANLGEFLLEPARRVVQERAFELATRELRIAPALLGDRAGVFGAFTFAAERARATLTANTLYL